MKYKALPLFVYIFIHFSCPAQSFYKGGHSIKFGLGTTSFMHQFPNEDLKRFYSFYRYRPYTAILELETELAIHNFVGFGFSIGIGGKPAGGVGYLSSTYSSELLLACGIFTNFHFFQLAAKNSSNTLLKDKLDLYVGISMGSGIAFFSPFQEHIFSSLFYVGPHLGARYFVKPNFAITSEVGYGKTITHFGLLFRLQQKRK